MNTHVMNIIAASGGVVGVVPLFVPLLILVLLIFGLSWAIKAGKLAEVLLIISGIGGCVALFLGFMSLDGTADGTADGTELIFGSILIFTGLHVLTILGLGLRKTPNK